VYSFRIYSDHVQQSLDSGGGPQDLHSFSSSFFKFYENNTFDNGDSKTFRSKLEAPAPNTVHGVLRYGRYGFGAEVEEVATGKISYKRTPTEAETIPIYFRVWAKEGSSYGLIGIQSYGGLSCVDLVTSTLIDHYKKKFPDFNLTAKKLIPNDRAIYGGQLVKKISFIKKQAPKASLRPKLRPDNCDTVDLELSITPKQKGSFGKLIDIDQRLEGTLLVDDIEHDGAFATIRTGGSTKRIGVLGLSSSAGVIDVTNDVDLDLDRHPELNSIAGVFESHMADFAKNLGQ